jgi:hypothetical protein
MGICFSTKNKNNSVEKLDENYKKKVNDIKDNNNNENQYEVNSNEIPKKKKK